MAINHEQVPHGLYICVGEQASALLRMHLPELKRLIKMESDATYHAPDIPFWRLRGRLHDLLRGPVVRINRCFKRRSNFGERLLNRIYPSTWFDRWTLQQEREWAWKDAQRLLQQSRLAVALMENRIVGVAGYKTGGKTNDGREIFEITKTCILPDFRKRGIYPLLRDAVVAMLRERHGSPPIMSFTRNPTVIRRCQMLGWQQISLQEYGTLLSRAGRNGLPEELVFEFKRHNWHAFIFDPFSCTREDSL